MAGENAPIMLADNVLTCPDTVLPTLYAALYAGPKYLLTRIDIPCPWERDNRKSLAAVGEIGLDFHYAPETAKAQCDLFAAQLELARELNLPVVIHTRDADDATLGVLDENDFHNGIIHCFTGSVPFERQLLDRGFMISISGIVTFRAAENVREAARYAPDDRLLVETDSPFLAPVPMRGNENEPSFLPHTVRFLAEQRKTTTESLALLTTANAERILPC